MPNPVNQATHVCRCLLQQKECHGKVPTGRTIPSHAEGITRHELPPCGSRHAPEGRFRLLKEAKTHPPRARLWTARSFLLGLVAVLVYSLVGAAFDVHPRFQRISACLLCKFCQDLSSADGVSPPAHLPVPLLLPARMQATRAFLSVADCFSPFGSRAPPAFPPLSG
mgnify:CR=1 FL=1